MLFRSSIPHHSKNRSIRSFANSGASSLTLSHVTVVGNSAGWTGGGIASDATNVSVRASIIDSFQNGFRTIVPEDAVGDQDERPGLG